MKLFVTLASLLAAAQADPFYGYGLHQQNWPSAYGPGFQATCWGCRGKRSADAWGYGYAPFALGLGYGRGIAGHPTGISFSNRSPQGLGKRDADADAFGYGYGGLGLGSGGFIRQSRVHPGYGGYATGGFAHLVGKRSADAFGYGYGYRALGGAGVHPTGFSYSNRSPQGAYGKRDADADALGLGAGGFIRQSRPYAAFGIHHNGYGAFAHPVGKRSADAYGYGYAGLGYGYGRGIAGHYGGGISFSNRSPQGLGKRDADADAYGYGYAPVLAKGYPSWPGVVAPGFESTCYGCGLGKRSADAEADADAAYYTQRSPQGAYGLGYYGYGHWGKRSADAFGYYGYAPFVGTAGLHPTGASYSNRSPQGLGKREAEADPWGYAPFYAWRPAAVSYSNRSPQGLGKREAGEEALAAHPNGATSFVGQTVWGFPAPAKAVEKREAEPAVSYSNRSPQGAYGYAPAYYWG